MRTHLAATCIIATALAGCVSASATMLNPGATQPPVPEAEVRVFLASDSIPAACQRYALIHAQGSANMTDETKMIEAARRRAGKIGANAVQLQTMRDPGTGRQIANALFGIGANRKGEMIAYRCGDTPAPATTQPVQQ